MEKFKEWKDQRSIKTVTCIHTDAEKYVVNKALTVGKEYEVKNETEEFIFIVDNTGKIGGYYQTYFE